MKKYIILIQLIILLTLSFKSYSQECNEFILAELKRKYKIGNFDEVVKQLNACLLKNFQSAKQTEEAYSLLAKTYIEIDSINSARLAATILIQKNPNYEPSLSDPTKFKTMIEEIKLVGKKITITSVSKKAETLTEAPATVISITQEEIKNKGYADLEALFSDLPGFDIARTKGATYSNIYQRGYRSNNTDRTLFMIDGVEENDFWGNFVYWQKQFPITNVKRIEIVYGPASTMYGANAFLGVVNVITKTPDEMIGKEKHIGGSVDLGTGSYKANYADVTLAAQHSGVSFSATVKRLVSEDMDLSGYEEYDYNPADYEKIDYKKLLSITSTAASPTLASAFVKKNKNSANFNNYYTIVRNAKGDTTAVQPTDAGVAKAMNFDKDAYKKELNGRPIEYSNFYDQWYFNCRLKVSDFVIGYEYWRSKQGTTNYANDNTRPGGYNGSIWIPKQTAFFIKYEKNITDNFSISNISQYRTTEIDAGSKIVTLKNYSNAGLTAVNLLANRASFWDSKAYYQLSRQFRNELKINYTPFFVKGLDIVAGFEVRNSTIQGDYLTSPDTVNVIEGGKSSLDTIAGGNDFTYYSTGVYAQGTYVIIKDLLKTTIGGRYDHNRIRSSGGYGSVFNPRIALVATPGKFIFKLIYASAFQDASSRDKYATAPVRLLNNPSLKPEKVTNYEVSLAYNPLPAFYVDLVYYNSRYSNVIGQVQVPYRNTTTGQNQAIGKLKIYGLQSTISYRYDAAIYGKYEFYANYNYTHPLNNVLDAKGNPTDEYQPVGDISANRFNMGVSAVYIKNLDVNLRFNFVSRRDVGVGTSVPANVKGDFPAYTLLSGAVCYRNLFISNLDIQLGINNIFNKEYFDPGIRSANGKDQAYRTPQPGRNYLLRVYYKF